ncbi:hypothetical protein DL239_18825 [Sedimentitalea sp. CY04]|uniref:Lysozyme inhibitor LprI N-terminal domain-containing protein n=2 Tax=Parasedimentitalea denitrificans TaxID=2211118 RepID=A0ABX0WBH0_9RHOB|nr:hypothetical protein [Sedimentitalea sp. CY04]
MALMALRILAHTWCFLMGIYLIAQGSAAAEFDIADGLVPGQKLIVIRGQIQTGDDAVFYKLAQQAERASVALESSGGDVDTEISIGAEIAIRGFTTLVLDGEGCHSICAVIWVSGVRRYMSPNADISVHAAYRLVNNLDGSLEVPESGMANAMIGAFLNEVGLSRQAIEYFTAARPNEPLLPITPEIAQALDIDVHIQDGFDVTTAAERPTPRRITRQVVEYFGLANNCGNLFRVDERFWRSQAEYTLKDGHNVFGGEAFAPLLGEYTSRVKAELERDGFVRWCLMGEANLRADGLSTGLTGPSYDCAKSTTLTEYAICSSKDLWAMDRAMANLYFYFRRNSDAQRSTEFLSSQRGWLKRRDACGQHVKCLIERYSSRLFDFGV